MLGTIHVTYFEIAAWKIYGVSWRIPCMSWFDCLKRKLKCKSLKTKQKQKHKNKDSLSLITLLIKEAVSRNSATLGIYKMPVKLRET